ncbi:MAG: hypothetical protein ACP5RD_03780 [bacterium]
MLLLNKIFNQANIKVHNCKKLANILNGNKSKFKLILKIIGFFNKKEIDSKLK